MPVIISHIARLDPMKSAFPIQKGGVVLGLSTRRKLAIQLFQAVRADSQFNQGKGTLLWHQRGPDFQAEPVQLIPQKNLAISTENGTALSNAPLFRAELW